MLSNNQPRLKIGFEVIRRQMPALSISRGARCGIWQYSTSTESEPSMDFDDYLSRLAILSNTGTKSLVVPRGESVEEASSESFGTVSTPKVQDYLGERRGGEAKS